MSMSDTMRPRRGGKKAFLFNIVAVGCSGLGKSTFINTLCGQPVLAPKNVDDPEVCALEKAVVVNPVTVEMEEDGVKLQLTIVDTPGFGDSIDNSTNFDQILGFIERQYDEVLAEESKIKRNPKFQDNRIHALLYFIAPTGHSLRELDIELMQRLCTRVNIIPVVAKSDTMTPRELQDFKRRIMEDLQFYSISYYNFPIDEEEDDEETIEENQHLRSLLPFAIVGSDENVVVNGRTVRGRQYPWGVVEVENLKHCDFSHLRSVLLSSHMQDLKDLTQDVLYEQYRSEKLSKLEGLADGGKDSCFNALHCVANGHDVVALANLHPATTSPSDELDSHMYQTVGHDVIDLYQVCFYNPASNVDSVLSAPPIPLFRRPINGTSKAISAYYDVTEQDEVEDLYELLSDVKRALPGVQGVSVGAILSNYQRVRVEHVCARLGLTCLAYLWQQDQVDLLASMVDARLDAILIKVAALGLDRRHLGKSLAQLQPHLLSMHQRYKLHPCGEGGEYETITLDSPLFRRRIEIVESHIVTHSDDAFAPVEYIKFDELRVVDKEQALSYEQVREFCQTNFRKDVLVGLQPTDIAPQTHISPPQVQRLTDSDADMNGLLALAGVRPRTETTDAGKATEDVMDQLHASLSALGLAFKDVVMTHIYIVDMTDFPLVNQAYGRRFGINPPARACVQVSIPAPHRVQIDMLVKQPKPNETKDVLHVQSISYWAPANIGPYSQCVKTDGHAFVAGQVALVPNTMQLPDPSGLSPEQQFAQQAKLSLCHMGSILHVVAIPRTDLVHCTCFVSSAQWHSLAVELWERWLVESDTDEENVVEYTGERPLLTVAAVPALPRGSLVEWLPVCYNRPFTSDSDDDDDDEPIRRDPHSKRQLLVDDTDGIKTRFVQQGTTVMGTLTVSAAAAGTQDLLIAALHRAQAHVSRYTARSTAVSTASLRVYYIAAFGAAFEQVFSRVMSDVCATFVPVDAIANDACVEIILHAVCSL
ncbi:hypothetical protein RI367_007062 [Sorochytrium milnesiophthora]